MRSFGALHPAWSEAICKSYFCAKLKILQAELIAIGDELLIGQTIDTNSAFIATQLNQIGISVKQKRVIADEAEAICEALDQVLPGTRLVFMTGGLGPTKDDITKKTLTGYFGGELEFHDEVFEHIKDLFASYGRTPSEANRSQAYLPSSCSVIPNKIGTASGMRFEREGTYFFSLPGVPYETRHLVGEQIIPWIQQNLDTGTVVHRTLLTQGVPESVLAEKLEEWEDQLPKAVKLAYLPSPGLVRLRLTSYQGTEEEAQTLVDTEAEKAREILGQIVFGEDLESLEEVVGNILRGKGLSLSAAESCTGGYISHKITSVPGSSDYFRGSVVSYTNEVKTAFLGVEADTITKYGVVSKEVAEAMARGAVARFASDFAVSTTGIAGPSGGTEEQPVGTVWIAVATPEQVVSKEFRFGVDRQRNIHRMTLMALDMLRRELKKFEI